MGSVTLLKVGGAELEEGPVLDELVSALAPLARAGQLVIVHGGGSEIARLQKRLGLTPRFVEGLRVTDKDSLQVAEMVLSGLVNKRLTARLVAQGVRAIGLSGVDGGLLRAEKLIHPAGDLGRVGHIVNVDVTTLSALLQLGLTPGISPLSLGEDGHPYNVNADHAAMAMARAAQVSEMILLTDVPGVLAGGQLLPELSASRARALIAEGVITGGMIPKVNSALEAVSHGVKMARITNLTGLAVNTGTRVLA